MLMAQRKILILKFARVSAHVEGRLVPIQPRGAYAAKYRVSMCRSKVAASSGRPVACAMISAVA